MRERDWREVSERGSALGIWFFVVTSTLAGRRAVRAFVHLPALYYTLLGLGLAGWALVFYATFLIDHFDLFGLRQVWLYFRGKPYAPLRFKVHSLYRHIRHPIMTGVFIGIWIAPTMSLGHLVFALGMSMYIAIGVYYEEKDLIQTFGKRYLGYMKTTTKFFPALRMSKPEKAAV